MKSHLRSSLVLAAAFVLLIAACGDSSTPITSNDARGTTVTAPPVTTAPPPRPAAPPQDYAGFRTQVTACGAQAPPTATENAYPEPDDLGLDRNTIIRARVETSCGAFVIELDPSIAPETVNSFVFLAREGYFDGTAAHRILPGFVLQAGDPTATGRGNPGYVVPDELPPNDFVYERGVLAMANAGPGTTGSQFFVMLGDSGIPPAYSVFGRIVEGQDVLDLITGLPLGDRPTGFGVETSVPLETLYLERVIIEE